MIDNECVVSFQRLHLGYTNVMRQCDKCVKCDFWDCSNYLFYRFFTEKLPTCFRFITDSLPMINTDVWEELITSINPHKYTK